MRTLVLASSVSLATLVVACGSSDGSRKAGLAECDGGECDAGTGGQVSQGGRPSAGGRSGSGGRSAAGGSPAGGRASAGGAPGSGGTSAGGGVSAGGASVGGTSGAPGDASVDASDAGGAASGGAGPVPDASLDGPGTADGSPESGTSVDAADGGLAGCNVGGDPVSPGATNPANPCEICDPLRSTTAYSNVPDGVSCSTCGTCAAGQCGATVLTASGAGSFVSLSGGEVFWADGQSATGAVWAISQQGGQARALVTGDITPVSVVSDGTNVYYAAFGTKAVKVVPLAGGTATGMLTVESPTNVLLAGGFLFAAAVGGPTFGLPGGLFRIALPSGAVTPIVSGLTSPYQLASDGTNVYWTDTYVRTVSAMPVGATPGGDAGVITELAAPTEAPQGIAVDATRVYFTTAQGGVYSVPAGGGTTTPLASGLENPLSVAHDGTSLYVAAWGTTAGGIFKVPAAGGAAVPLYTQGRAYGIAVGADCVYASTQDIPSNLHKLIRLDK